MKLFTIFKKGTLELSTNQIQRMQKKNSNNTNHTHTHTQKHIKEQIFFHQINIKIHNLQNIETN